jgi:hypothetical protein
VRGSYGVSRPSLERTRGWEAQATGDASFTAAFDHVVGPPRSGRGSHVTTIAASRSTLVPETATD